MKLRRLLSLALVLAVAISLFGGISLTAFAHEANEYGAFSIQGIQEPVVGQLSTVDGIDAEGNENGRFRVDAQWYSVTYTEDGIPLYTEFDGIYQKDHTYALDIIVTILDKYYSFSHAVHLTVGDRYQFVMLGKLSDTLEVDREFLTYHLTDPISGVEITGVQNVAAGQQATAEGLKVNTGNCVITTAQWLKEDEEGTLTEFSGIFEEGYAYYLSCRLSANPGYLFADEPAVVEGKKADTTIEEYTMDVLVLYDLREVVAGPVEIVGIPEVKPGAPVSVEGITLKTDLPCVISDVVWYQTNTWSESTPVETETFEAGVKYELQVCIKAQNGYAFGEGTELYYNGQLCEAPTANTARLNIVLDGVEFDLRTEVSKITLTSTYEPKVGDYPNNSGVLTVAEKSAVSILDSRWWQVMENGEFDTFFGALKENTVYVYYMRMSVYNGYRFADTVTVEHNGNILGEYEIDGEWLDITPIVFTGNLKLVKRVKLFTKIQENMAVEDAVVTIPEDAEYSISEYYWVDTQTGERVTGRFKRGRSYGVVAKIEAAEGYFVSDETTFVINDDTELSYETSHAYVHGFVGAEIPLEEVEEEIVTPPTADNFNVWLPMTLMFVSVIGMTLILTRKKNQYRN